MQEEEQKIGEIWHKLQANKKIRVFKSTFNDKDFYKTQIPQKNYDKTEDKFYISLTFKKGIELQNGTDIIIKKAVENFRKNPKDQYNPISYYVVTDFETVENQEQLEAQAYGEYQQKLDEISNEDLPF